MEPGAADRGHKQRSGFLSELNLYYLLVGLYFLAFGMQFVLFPSLVAFALDATPAGVGLAQSALSAPMFCLLLFGGLLAERARAGTTLALLYLGFAFMSLILGAVVAAGQLTYAVLIAYAVIVGSCAAFAMPIRDAALNGIVEREALRGIHTPIATAAAITTAVQIGAQIVGILIAQFAGKTPAPYLAIQALALALGAAVALLGMKAPKPSGHERTLLGALRDLREGLAYSFRDPVMSPMLISAAYVGVFVIGAFQVLFPLIIRDAYGGDDNTQQLRLGALLACFWSASFVSAVVLSRLKPLRQPGRALVISHLIGAAALFSFGFHKPFALFAVIVVLWGFAAGVAISTSRTIVQGAAGQRFLGRVLAVYSMGFMGGAPIGSALVGFAASQWGARAAALAPATGLTLAALALALFTPLWRYTPVQQINDPDA
ncbi:MAG: MFS transporter [Hyphomonadaceae bacterium]|nr:MFS transporter [Hyphomonadaceae bacterium]MCA8885068.1 MFS transporter [Hyphomonadaceae bacterium]